MTGTSAGMELQTPVEVYETLALSKFGQGPNKWTV